MQCFNFLTAVCRQTCGVSTGMWALGESISNGVGGITDGDDEMTVDSSSEINDI